MKAGKVSEQILKRTILKQLNSKNSNVVLSSAVGEDCSRLRSDNKDIIFSVNPITIPLEVEDMGKHGIYRAFNNISAKGATPVAALVSLLMPTSSNEQDARTIIKGLDAAASKLGVQVIGGHTECCRGVNVPIITITGVGLAERDIDMKTSNVEPGMDIIATNWVGIEGTLVLLNQKREELLQHFTNPFLDKISVFEQYLSINEEAKIACNNNAATIHDISEGGIFAALWELAEGSKVGLEIDSRKIPIKQETIEVCEFFDINPYKIASMGSALIAAKDGNTIVHEIEKAGGHATIIGKATDNNDRVLLIGEEKRFLETPQTDELRKVLTY